MWLEDDYRKLLSSLKDDDLDKCLKHFATKALQLGNTADERVSVRKVLLVFVLNALGILLSSIHLNLVEISG